MKFKLKLKMKNGEVKEHVCENVVREKDNIHCDIAATNQRVTYKWDEVSKYEHTKINEGLQKLNEGK